MKAVSFFLFCILVLTNFSCTKEAPGVNNTDVGKLKKVTPNLLPGGSINFGEFPLSPTNRITSYGPNGSGWKGIIIGAVWPIDIAAAKAAGYQYIFAAITKDDIQNNISSIPAQISTAKNAGCNYFYIDDGLSGGGISQTQIESVASMVHNAGCQLATCEYSQDSLYTHQSWFNHVDIIMPYNYYMNVSQLQNFYQFVRTNFTSKILIPMLGYYADINPAGTFAYQKGNASGDPGFIEMAKGYASMNLIFYYHHWIGPSTDDLNNFNDLTYYLQEFYGMGGGI